MNPKTNNIKRLNAAEIQQLDKEQRRAACKARGIKYAQLSAMQQRDAILEWEENRVKEAAPADAVLDVAPAEPQKQAAYQATTDEQLDAQVQASPEKSPPKKTTKKVERTSVMSVLRDMEVGKPVSIEFICESTGVKRASLMTTALSCNSTAPSNRRLYETGLRFKRDGDNLVRTA